MSAQTSTFTVKTAGAAPYEIVVGRSILDRVSGALDPAVRKVLVVHPPTLADRAAELRDRLVSDTSNGPREVLLAEIPDAESGKRIEVAAFCWQIMGQSDFTRTDAVIGYGGGAVTDVAGFVAATWLRGIQVVQVPTTVLGLVDAAIGGKTGINTNEGKNLVGAFWAPRAVIGDLDEFGSLSANEATAGYAEVVKAGFIWAPEILDIIEADPARAVDTTTQEFRRTIELAIDMKAQVVSNDFREAGQREILNYGHTLGHAIEHAERYRWRHGAAISIGMMFAAELSRLAGRLPDAAVQRHRDVLESLGLPTSYRSGAWATLLSTMQRDKKSRGGMLRFIVLDDIAKPTVLQAPDESLLFAAYQEVGA
ncbi:3-dehydroquinate synthase [Microbacterium keratanolyticum]|uniref:3-dehydroquinate synthase n=1 Tax=Microbacterium keratanolyticum TaxID=67574 RepID=A0A9W6M9C3_9MICO|nr:3-dehydroquinate synthase [Microbacterium keratanolyticum]MBM7470361.1 3-dehydroquinate synthase [Microbacterium keratanolyticum]GLK02438.1 3-dehydroquinate synthase [Microbacterium keratanolyticum]